MSLNKKKRAEYYSNHAHGWGDIPPITFPRREPPNDADSYYPQDFDDMPIEYREGSARYASWKGFKEKYPKNAELLVHLFGERDAIECHRHMVVVSELKAAMLCAHFPSPTPKRNRLGPVSDC